MLDGAPSHRSEEIGRPENVVSLLTLPAYSPQLNPVERWFQEEFRRALSNRTSLETVEHLLQEALTRALAPYSYWEEPARLQRLTGFSWWVEAVDAL